jgi:hypothetical protein
MVPDSKYVVCATLFSKREGGAKSVVVEISVAEQVFTLALPPASRLLGIDTNLVSLTFVNNTLLGYLYLSVQNMRNVLAHGDSTEINFRAAHA